MTTEDGRGEEPLWPMAQPTGGSGSAAGQPASRQSAVWPGPVVSAQSAGAGSPASAQEVADLSAPSVVELEQPAEKRKRRPRGRHAVLIATVAIAVVVGVAGGIALNTYGEQTKIDRSTPTVAVTQLVDAMFTARDEAAVARFSCKTTQLAALRDLAETIAGQERSHSTHIAVSVDSMRLRDKSTVETKLNLAGAGWSTTQPWTFDVADQDGWRICGARKTE